jgi:hypothetical protein
VFLVGFQDFYIGAGLAILIVGKVVNDCFVVLLEELLASQLSKYLELSLFNILEASFYF